jgi:ferredoxin
VAHVITANCNDCKYTDCCAVCPVECFYQDEMMLYIDPMECTDCGACVEECPVQAIFPEDNIPEVWADYVKINKEAARRLKKGEGGHITAKQPAKEGPGCKKG